MSPSSDYPRRMVVACAIGLAAMFAVAAVAPRVGAYPSTVTVNPVIPAPPFPMPAGGTTLSNGSAYFRVNAGRCAWVSCSAPAQIRAVALGADGGSQVFPDGGNTDVATASDTTFGTLIHGCSQLPYNGVSLYAASAICTVALDPAQNP